MADGVLHLSEQVPNGRLADEVCEVIQHPQLVHPTGRPQLDQRWLHELVIGAAHTCLERSSLEITQPRDTP